jgi:hypothetical protein
MSVVRGFCPSMSNLALYMTCWLVRNGEDKRNRHARLFHTYSSPPNRDSQMAGLSRENPPTSMAADLRANRTLSKRAIERDVAAELQLSDDGDDDDDSDGDATYGSKAAGAKRQRQRRGKAVLQALKQQSLQPLLSPATVSKPELDRDFAPLSDLKGVTPQAVLGRRITVWYSDDAGTVTPAHGLVTYLCDEQARLFVVFDGDEELDGLWVDGRDEWAWADESQVGAAPPARPVPGCWRPEAKWDESSGRKDACAAGGPVDPDSDPEALDGQLGAVEKIFLVRCCGRRAPLGGAPRAGATAAPTSAPTSAPTAALELFVKWRGLAHIHSQWVPQTVLEASGACMCSPRRPPFPHRWVPQSVLEASGALNKRAVGRFLKEVSASDGLSDRLSDRLSDGLSDGL